MYKIINKEILGPGVKKVVVEAGDIAAKALPGQFVVIRVDEKGERIPLTIACVDKEKGLVTIIFQEAGFSTRKLGKLNTGETILDVLGPLGHPSEIKKYGTVVCVAGGVGVAEVFPVASAMRKAGNKVIGIIGARSKDLLILERQIRQACDELFVTTDDGSYGKKGLVTDMLKNISEHARIDLVYAIGPVPMMEAVANLTRTPKIKTIVSLNPIMVDATGMCGSCRVSIGHKVKFCCVDGPDFDAHEVNFSELKQRLELFRKEEEIKKKWLF